MKLLNYCALCVTEGKEAVEIAIQNNHFKVLERLFDFNANPEYLRVEDGDTPIHAALHIALDRDKGIHLVIEVLLYFCKYFLSYCMK
jgi:hypothetical protein